MDYFVVEEKNTKGFGQSYLLKSINHMLEESEFVAYLNGLTFKGTIVNVRNKKDEEKLLKFAEIMSDRVEHFPFISLSACRHMFPELEYVYNGSYFTFETKQ